MTLFYFNKSRSLEKEHDNNFEQCNVFFLRVIRPEQGVYSRVHISSDEVFSKILKKPSIVQK